MAIEGVQLSRQSPGRLDMASKKTLYRGFEGGAVYTAEKKGTFLVIIDESTMADILSEDDLAGMELVRTIEFTSELERSEYLVGRFGPARSGASDLI